jgi:hypothetical protein
MSESCRRDAAERGWTVAMDCDESDGGVEFSDDALMRVQILTMKE